MERTVGVEQARVHLGRLAEEVSERSEVIVLTRRGRPLAVLMGPAGVRARHRGPAPDGPGGASAPGRRTASGRG